MASYEPEESVSTAAATPCDSHERISATECSAYRVPCRLWTIPAHVVAMSSWCRPSRAARCGTFGACRVIPIFCSHHGLVLVFYHAMIGLSKAGALTPAIWPWPTPIARALQAVPSETGSQQPCACTMPVPPFTHPPPMSQTTPATFLTGQSERGIILSRTRVQVDASLSDDLLAEVRVLDRRKRRMGYANCD